MTDGRLDCSISMGRANVFGLLIVMPLIASQAALYYAFHGAEKMENTWWLSILVAVILLGIVVHELIHGVTWAVAGRKSFSKDIQLGFSWKNLTPFAHVKGPLEVNAYRLGTLAPSLVLGILPYFLALALGNGNLFLFSLVHTALGVGDFMILWLIRNVKSGALVEDHPTHAGCVVIEK